MEPQNNQVYRLKHNANEIRAIQKRIESFQNSLNLSWNATEMARVNLAINLLVGEIRDISKDIDIIAVSVSSNIISVLK